MSVLPAPHPERRRRRRRRTDGEPPRGLLLLPHLITTAGLFFGFYAIVHALGPEPRLDRAATAIILAAICDALDGRIARMARATSRFGGEYDSLSDIVCFGVAPAVLALSAGNLQVLGRTGWVMAFLFTVCTALRLARFNVSPSRYRGRFEGLPCPAAAGVVATTQWFASWIREQGLAFSVPESLVAGGVAVLGLLMVSSIPYRSFKELDLRHSYGTLVVVVLGLIVIVQEPSVTLFACGLVYTLSGPLEWVWRRASGRSLEEAGDPLPPNPSQG